MEGSASRIGDSGYNQRLSEVRVYRVAEFLMSKGIDVNQMQLHAVGAAGKEEHALDEERDRAVSLVVHPRAKVDPPPPKHVPPKPKTSRQFKIALLGELSVTALLKRIPKLGPTVDVIFFQIWDTTNNLASIYMYYAIGLGASLKVLPWHSATKHGPWNEFRTSVDMSSSQFGGWASYFSAGTWRYTVNCLEVLLVDYATSGGRPAIFRRWLNTGPTYRTGISLTRGDLKLMEGPGPFSDP